ncbi:ATP-binding protein [Planktothrix pseudagardhii]|uniref:histidine kinase n=1 Tax=Planktothrix pseudagardhii TaxID=132604 RepID=A0A9W4CGR6_9CYAN|nr:ATP-binding protein [Planktothrix pseudagardhii]CAD5930747.1 Sensor kinase CckA [Planktothrix pseudagardhii]
MMNKSDLTTVLIIDNHSLDLQAVLNLFSLEEVNLLSLNPVEADLNSVIFSLPDLIFIAVDKLDEKQLRLCEQLNISDATQHIPIIWITDNPDKDCFKKALSLGIIDYLSTYIEKDELFLKLKSYCKMAKERKAILKTYELLEEELVCQTQENLELKEINNKLEVKVECYCQELAEAQDKLKQEITESQKAKTALYESLSQIKVIQNQLVNSEKMSALGQMLAGIAHEINNPVNFIYGNLAYVQEYIDDILKIFELYQQYYPQPNPTIQEEAEAVELDFILEDLPKMLESMQVGAERIREIVLSLRSFARQDGSKMKAINLHEGIDNTLMILQNRLKSKPDHPAIRVIKEYSPALPLVECYGGEMNQVFMNILANAIDAIEENSQHKNLEELKVNPNKIWIKTDIINDHNISITIRDNAGGMAEDIIHHLFEPFFTTKPVGKGTGIGLSISQHIVVEKHNGSLRCISTPGEGTEFIIEIPMTQELPTPKNIAGNTEEKSSRFRFEHQPLS